MKRVVNFLLIATISYCLTLWVFIAGCVFFGLNSKEYYNLGMIISLVTAVAVALLVWAKTKETKLVIEYNNNSGLVDSLDNRLQQLGFQPKSTKRNRYKYKGFEWFSLVDPTVNIRLKSSNKVVVKGRKHAVDKLANQLRGAA